MTLNMFNVLQIFSYAFMDRALIAGLLIALVAPTVGLFFVVRRFSALTDALAHVSLAGVAIGFVVGLPAVPSAIGASLLASFGIERLRKSRTLPPETILTLILFGSLALGVAILGSSHGRGTGSLLNYLFGSILTVQTADLWHMAAVTLVILLGMYLCRRKFFLIALDEDVALTSGVPVTLMNNLLLAFGSTAIAIAMNVVGVLLVGSLMVIPVLCAIRLQVSFKKTWILSVIISLISVIIGLILAFVFNLPPGAVIALCTTACFLVISIIKA